MSSQLSKDLSSLRIDRAPARRSGAPKTIVVLALVGALAAAGWVYGKPAIEARLFQARVNTTEILSISPAQASIDVTSTGYVVPQAVAKVGTDVVAGRISKVHVTEGQLVEAGAVLFELDATQLGARVAGASSRVASARARAQAARAAVDEARIPYERQKKLVEAGAVGSATTEDMAARITALEAQARAVEAEAGAAAAEVRVLETERKLYQIVSPIRGVVQNKPAQVGDVVTPTMPLVELVDPDSLLVETDVPESRMDLVRVGQPCEIVLESSPKVRHRGEVAAIGPRVNRAKASATVKVRFVDRPERLSPEMSARVSFLSKPLDEAAMKAPPKILVPKAAVTERGGERVVFALDDGKVKRIAVVLGAEEDQGFLLEKGPPPGTRLVSDPPAELRDGQSVKEGEE